MNTLVNGRCGGNGCIALATEAITNDGNELLVLCPACFAALEQRLGAAAFQYHALIAQGILPRMAERIMSERIGRGEI